MSSNQLLKHCCHSDRLIFLGDWQNVWHPLTFDGTAHIIVQRCQIAAPRWLNDISSVVDNAILKTGSKTSSVASAVWHVAPSVWNQMLPLSSSSIFVNINSFNMRAGFLCLKCDSFACLHTRQDQNKLHLKRWFFLSKLASSVSRSQEYFPALYKRVHNYIRSAEG